MLYKLISVIELLFTWVKCLLLPLIVLIPVNELLSKFIEWFNWRCNSWRAQRIVRVAVMAVRVLTAIPGVLFVLLVTIADIAPELIANLRALLRMLLGVG